MSAVLAAGLQVVTRDSAMATTLSLGQDQVQHYFTPTQVSLQQRIRNE